MTTTTRSCRQVINEHPPPARALTMERWTPIAEHGPNSASRCGSARRSTSTLAVESWLTSHDPDSWPRRRRVVSTAPAANAVGVGRRKSAAAKSRRNPPNRHPGTRPTQVSTSATAPRALAALSVHEAHWRRDDSSRSDNWTFWRPAAQTPRTRPAFHRRQLAPQDVKSERS